MDATLTIRPSGRRDLAEVDRMLADSFPRLLRGHYPPSVMVTAVPLLAHVRPDLLVSGSHYVVVALDRIVGAGGWSRDPGGARASVRQLVTDFRLVRRGIGRALMSHVLAEAGAAGITTMECLSTRNAEPFYQAMGFTTLGMVEIGLAPGIGFAAVRMQRRL